MGEKQKWKRERGEGRALEIAEAKRVYFSPEAGLEESGFEHIKLNLLIFGKSLLIFTLNP